MRYVLGVLPVLKATTVSAPAYEHVIVDYPAEHVARVRLNRPKARNALSNALVAETAAAVRGFEADPAVRVIVVAGGEKAFAAGADISEFTMGPIEIFQENRFDAWDTVARARKPVIAAVAGFALGGGSELMMMCDIIVAAESATFGQPEILLGLIPGAGGTQRLPRAVGKYLAMEVILADRRLSAAEALHHGLVNHVVPDAELDAKALAIAAKIAALSPTAARLAKQAVNNAFESPLQAGLTAERDAFYFCFASQDKVEGTTAFLEKRKAVFTGK